MSIQLQASFLVCNFLSDEIDTVIYGLQHPEFYVDFTEGLDDFNSEVDEILQAIA